MTPEILQRIIKADLLIQRLGHWPDFHDAEVLRVVLERDFNGSPVAVFSIHVWNMLSEIDERGYYRMDKHTLVELRAAQILECKLADFNHQNVIFDIEVTADRVEEQPALRLAMSTSYGLSADVLAKTLEVVSVRPCDASGQPERG